MATRRSTIAFLAVGVGIVATFQGLPRLQQWFSGMPDFEPLDNPAGFRRMAGGASSTATFDPFAGLDGRNSSDEAAMDDKIASNLCGALFEDAATAADTVPIAYFSDAYCPYCRVLTPRLVKLQNELRDEIQIVWHELPLLGESSELAARATLAAKRQGAFRPFQDALMSSSFQANPEYLAVVAERIGLDPGQLMRDMDSAAVAREVATSKSLARIFGFIGTPVTVIGRTVIQGAVSDATLRRVIEIEREEGRTAIC